MAYKSKLKGRFTDEFFTAMLLLETEEECYRFFEDVSTVSEVNDMAQRFAVAKRLSNNETYTLVTKNTGASTATISRVKRALNYGAGGYRIVLGRLKQE